MHNDPELDVLPQIRSDDFLPSISRWTRLGGVVILASFGAIVALSAGTDYSVTVRAPASVRPTGDLRLVQAPADGTVERIEVKDYQQVRQGDAIAQIDDSDLKTRQTQLQESLQRQDAELFQISAQRRALAAQIAAESAVSSRQVASAQADLSRIQQDYQERQATSLADVQEAEAALALAQEERDRYQSLAATGAISQLQISEKVQSYRVAEARLERARAVMNPSNATIDIAQEQIAQTQAKGDATLATLAREQEALTERQIQLENQIIRDRSELEQISLQLEQRIIRASYDGVILNLNLRNEGQVVHAGEAIAQIAPANTPFVVFARVSAQDIGKVEVGQPVQMRISAYPYPDYGVLSGTINAIAPDAISLQTNSGEPASTGSTYFEVSIEPEAPYLRRNGQRYTIQAGMEARADIITQKETVMNFILRKARLITDW